MKTLIYIIGIILCVTVSGGVIWWAKVNYFEAGGLAVTESRDVDAAYRLRVKGDDLRVYEFTPKGAPNKLCVVTAGERNSMQFCFDK